MNSYRTVALALVLGVVLASSIACAAQSTPTPTPSPTPSPTPPPTFEQKRSEVLKYLKAFNTVDNALDDTASKIIFPQTLNTAADLIAYNAAITQYLTAVQGAIARLAELQPTPLEPDTAAHLLKARSLAETARQLMEGMKQALSSGNTTTIQQQASKLQASEAEISSVNRATEQLLFKYNIPDAEVAYRSRGK